MIRRQPNRLGLRDESRLSLTPQIRERLEKGRSEVEMAAEFSLHSEIVKNLRSRKCQD